MLEVLYQFRRDDALGQGEAAIKATLTCLDDAVGILGTLIESISFDRHERPMLALGSIDLGLNLFLDGSHFQWGSDNLHASCSVIDEAVQRHHRQYCLG